MTTPITLTVGAITLTFSKWRIGVDHGMLFQESDRQRRRHPDIDYSYYAEHPEEDPAQSEICFCRSLGSMLPRLELLGYTLATVKAEYEMQVTQDAERYADEEGDGAPSPTRPERLEFEKFIEFIRRYPV
ncbi:MAG: HEPN/Toprim-associated domain-containing protein, partial [Burkholderiaceae bacterium]|nr:HEPN/Toprim-associated domain-containing protein [Burkholderiaceae bacterium]